MSKQSDTMTRLDEIKARLAAGTLKPIYPVSTGSTITYTHGPCDNDIAWLIAEVERLRAVINEQQAEEPNE